MSSVHMVIVHHRGLSGPAMVHMIDGDGVGRSNRTISDGADYCGPTCSPTYVAVSTSYRRPSQVRPLAGYGAVFPSGRPRARPPRSIINALRPVVGATGERH